MNYNYFNKYCTILGKYITEITPTIVPSALGLENSEVLKLKEKYDFTSSGNVELLEERLKIAKESGNMVGHKKKVKYDKNGIISSIKLTIDYEFEIEGE